MPSNLFDWTLVKIRRVQLWWEIKNLGGFLIFYLALFPFLLFLGYKLFQTDKFAWFAFGSICASVLGIHLGRRDLPFVYQHFEAPKKAIFWEYYTLYSVFVLPAVLSSHWYMVFLFWGSIFIISRFQPNFKKRTTLPKLNRLIPAKYFEAIGGLRQSIIPVSIVYFLALSTSWIRGIPLFFLWLVTVIITTFFSHAEPLHILRETKHSINGFLWGKISNYGLILIIAYAPICLINYFFHPELWALHALMIPMQIGLLAVVIFFKYASYYPNVPLKQNQAIVSINAFAALVPFLLPVPLLFGFIYYHRAKKNLKYYLHD